MVTMLVTVYRNEEMIAQASFLAPEHLTWIEDGKKEKWWGEPDTLRFEIEDISARIELENIMRTRQALYPSPEEFLNAFFDGGDAAIEELRQKRLAVKAKYPKPQTGEK